MSRSVDETRREFLLKLARTAALVPPAIATLDVQPGAAQKGKATAAPAAAPATAPTAASSTVPTTAPVTGSLSPVGPASSTFSSTSQLRGTEEAAPWDAGGFPSAPPWSKPPPTQTGR